MEFTYYGHSCFLVHTGTHRLLFDPFITHNELAKNIDITKIEADYIFISHGHIDHIADAVKIALHTKAMVVSNWEIYEWLGKKGLTNIHPMNTGGSKQFDFGSVKCVTAQHSSGLPDGSYGGNPMGFIIQSSTQSFYYSGDTALTLDMQLIPLWASLSFCILPIGNNFTMDVADAIKAASFVQCNKVIGVHYNTFGFIVIDKELAQKQFMAAGAELFLPAIGSSITI